MSLALKPSHASVKAYYEALHQFGQLYIDHEGAVRSAFQTLLAKCGQRADPKLTLVPEYRIKRGKSSVIVDGALVDLCHLPHGYWEAKDEKDDDLLKEVQRKLDKGYPPTTPSSMPPNAPSSIREARASRNLRLIQFSSSIPRPLSAVLPPTSVYSTRPLSSS